MQDVPLATNPFARLKLRELLLWFLAATIPYAFMILWMDDAKASLLGHLIYYATVVSWMIYRLRASGVRIRRLVGPVPRVRFWVVGLGLTLVAGALYFGLLVSWTGPLSRWGWLMQGSASPRLRMVSLHVAPFIEEILFRGIILHRFAYKWGMSRAVAYSSILFGIAHPHPVGALIFGLLLSILYLRSGSLVLTTACHLLFNSASGWMSGFEWAADRASKPWLPAPWFGALLLGLAVPIVWYLRRNWPAPAEAGPYFCQPQIELSSLDEAQVRV